MYKITIAIPVYNVENYIEKSLISALNQSYSNIEFLIIDDQGEDNSIEIVERIKRNHPRGGDIRIIHHRVNQGTGATRNTAIDNALGDYLFFLDSDDTIERDTVELLVQTLSEGAFDVVESSFQRLESKQNILKRNVLPNDTQLGDFAICKWMMAHRRYYDGYPWNRLYRLEFLRDNKIRCIPNHKNEDVFFSFQLVMYAKSFKTISNLTYNYYMREGSTVHQALNEYYYNQYIEIIDYQTEKLRHELTSKKMPQLLYNYYLQHFFEWWLFKVLGSDISYAMKKKFYTHIKSDVLSLDLMIKDFIGYRYKILYFFLKHCNTKHYYLFSTIEKRFYQAYKLIRGKHGVAYKEIV